MNCLPLSAYCERTGQKKKTIDQRIQRGIWLEGVHFFKPEGVRERWIDTKAIDEWVRNGGRL